MISISDIAIFTAMLNFVLASYIIAHDRNSLLNRLTALWCVLIGLFFLTQSMRMDSSTLGGAVFWSKCHLIVFPASAVFFHLVWHWTGNDRRRYSRDVLSGVYASAVVMAGLHPIFDMFGMVVQNGSGLWGVSTMEGPLFQRIGFFWLFCLGTAIVYYSTETYFRIDNPRENKRYFFLYAGTVAPTALTIVFDVAPHLMGASFLPLAPIYFAIGCILMTYGVVRHKALTLTPAAVGWKVFDGAAEPLLLMDEEAVIKSVNPALCEIFRQSSESLIGEPLDVLLRYSASSEDSLLPLVMDILNGEPVAGEERWFRSQDGRRFRLLLSLSALRHDDGELSGILMAGLDITSRVKMEEALAHSRANLRALIENTEDLIWSVDSRAKLLAINSAGRAVLGMVLRMGIALGDSFLEELPDGLRGMWEGYLQRALGGERFSVVTRHAFGRRGLPYEIAFNPIRESSGAIAGVSIFARDMTERFRFEAEMRRLSVVARHTTNGVYITDSSYRIEWVNEGFTRITGYQAADVLGRDPVKLLVSPEADVRDAALLQERTSDERSVELEILARRKSGEDRWISLEAHPLRDEGGEFSGYMALQTDVTERREYEEELRRSRDEAEAATLAKSQFLANMSHELRTPLNIVIGMSSLLRETGLTDEQEEFAEMIVKGGGNLLELINNILDLSKAEAERMELSEESFDLRASLQDWMETFSHSAAERKLELLTDLEPSLPFGVIGDPMRLRQIVTNLVANALKFTESGIVYLRAFEIDRSHDRVTVEIQVEDTGMGIPRERHELIFDPFSQIDGSTTRRFGGTGLGLAISRRLVELMGGKIRVDSEPGKGSTFIFSVGLAVPRDGFAPADNNGADRARLVGRRVGLVLNNEALRTVVETRLRGIGMEVSTAGSIEVLMRRDSVDAVFTDGNPSETIPAEHPVMLYLRGFARGTTPVDDNTVLFRPLNLNQLEESLQSLLPAESS